MKIKIRKVAASVAAATGLSLGLLGGSAVVPNVAHAAAPGTYDSATQWVCFTIKTYSPSYGVLESPYSWGPVKIQVWWNGGPYTVWEGRANAEGCIYANYIQGWWWRVAAADQFDNSLGGTSYYGADTGWFDIDGSRNTYPTATRELKRGVAWPG